MVGLPGPELTPEIEEAVKEYGLRHFIFFSRNLSQKERAKTLLSALKKKRGFLAVDQEGGPVARLRPPLFPKLSAPLELARKKDPLGAVAQEARVCAQHLKKYGFNLNLAPVLDLGDEKAPSFLRGRTFGSDPEKVALLGQIYVRTFLDEGLLCCAKHFPGLGGVEVDPHQGLPVKETVEEEDLLPFLEAIRIGVPAVMTTHLLIPAWDKEPATFSSKIVKFLRENLGFKGLILTDDLFMGGALARASLEEAVLRAFLAGHDLLLLCGEFHKSIDALAIFSEECQKSLILRKKVGEKLSFIEKQLHPSINLTNWRF